MRTRTVTALGLSLRTELRLKSLLAVIGSRTVERWSFHDDADADVALCDPDSALAARALRRGGPQRLVFIVDEGAPTPAGRCLHQPVRGADLIDLLNEVSADLASTARGDTKSGDAAVPPRFEFALAVRDACGPSRPLARLESDGVAVYVDPAAGVVHIAAALEVAALHAALRDGGEPTVYPVAPDDLGRAAPDLRTVALDELLWGAGLHARGGLVSTVPPDAAVKLCKWPDFGRLEYADAHLRMAARLTRAYVRLPQLAAALAAPVDEVTAFVNACALCGLVEVQRGEARARAPRPSVSGASPTVPLLRRIRSALGLRS